MKKLILTAILAALGPEGSLVAQADPLDSQVRVRVDSERGEIVLAVSGIHVPEATPYSHHPSESRFRFRWPAPGWVQGYRIDLLDSAGRILPREMLHHAGVANLDRRELAYPIPQRMFAVGRETRPVRLPGSIGVPVNAGEEMLLYYALVNSTSTPVDGATLEIRLRFAPKGASRKRDVMPLYLDANPEPIGGTRAFDVRPGISLMTAQFTLPTGGRLRAVGAHLHDFAVEIRLEDPVAGRLLARLETKRDASGRLISVPIERFLFKRGGLRLEANHPYRVVSVYENPGSETIPHGAMAFLAGIFVPGDPSLWPTLDRSAVDYQRDLQEIAPAQTGSEHQRHPGASN